MKFWPFGKKIEVTKVPLAQAHEPSTMDRLLTRNCSRDEFFLLYFKLLQERMPNHQLEMTGESVVRAVSPQGKESTTYMDNAWLQYSRDAENRQMMLERYLGLAVSLTEPSEPVVPERIVAMIKDSEYMSLFKSEHEPCVEHLCGDLWVVYAEDLPERMRSLKRSDVAAAGVAEDAIKELAKENLRKVMPPAEQHGDGPWYLLTAGGDYTASLLLFDGLWNDLAGSVDGDLVVVAPARDVIFFTGAESTEGLAAIRKHSAEILTSGSYLISGTLLVRKEGQWDVFNAN
jgi:uncharacterized protein YtpQ (UPF0354 family)